MTEETQHASRPLWLRLWPLYLIAGGLIAAWFFGLFDYLSLETLRQQQASLRAFVEDNLILAIAAYVGVHAFRGLRLLSDPAGRLPAMCR